MPARLGEVLCVALILASCGERVPVKSAQQAIWIGSAICEHDWGGKPGIDFRALRWQARFFNEDRWRVWADNENKNRLEIIVPKSGQSPSACALYSKFPSHRIQDTSQNKLGH